MKYLLDTHVILWSLVDDEHICSIRDLLQDPRNDIYCSTANIWEIAIKYDKGNLPFPPEKAIDVCREQGYKIIDIKPEHAVAVTALNYPDNMPTHSDPFDKILIAQAKYEGMCLLTADQKILNYEERCIRGVR